MSGCVIVRVELQYLSTWQVLLPPLPHPSTITYHYVPLMSGCVIVRLELQYLSTWQVLLPPSTHPSTITYHYVPLVSGCVLVRVEFQYLPTWQVLLPPPPQPQHHHLPLCPSSVWLCDSEIGASIPLNLAGSTTTPSPHPSTITYHYVPLVSGCVLVRVELQYLSTWQILLPPPPHNPQHPSTITYHYVPLMSGCVLVRVELQYLSTWQVLQPPPPHTTAPSLTTMSL